MRFLIMTDIEGVTGVTTYQQAENSQFGRDMLMNDLLAVIDGIRAHGNHEIVVYDMHTDGRNVDMSLLPEDVDAVVGKPIRRDLYRGVGPDFDGLFLVGLHAMGREPGALLAHSYLIQYDAIWLNGEKVGEIGIEAALAGEQGIPLVFVSGDDKGCEEALSLNPQIVTAVVKESLGDFQARCYTPAKNREILKKAAQEAAAKASCIRPMAPQLPVQVQIDFSQCRYLEVMQQLHPELFTEDSKIAFGGDNFLRCWSDYLLKEKEMISNA